MNNQETLTPAQQRVLQELSNHIGNNGYAPSVRELCEAAGLKSPASVHHHLSKLEEKGYIKREPGKSRIIELCDSPAQNAQSENIAHENTVRYVPLVGDIAAGTGVIAEELVEEMLPLPKDFAPDGELFMLKVRGDSMIDAGIFDGDFVVVQSQPDARNGEIVAAGIPDGEATVKTFKQEQGGKIRLQAANPSFEDILLPASEVAIYGKVVTVMRRL